MPSVRRAAIVIASLGHYNGTQQEYRTATPYVGDARNDRASSVKLL
ncbi:hypothetical protein [Streptomyces sp. ERV7]|nr:hypothetical protein [Streptomyces sp. ERV7]